MSAGDSQHGGEFRLPDWNEPLNLEERLAQVPPTSINKGIIVAGAVRRARERTGREIGTVYSALSDVPVVEQIRVLVECAAALFPDVSPREGLRRLGRQVLPELRENTAGRLLFSVAGNNVFAAVKLVGRAYRLFTSTDASAEIQGDNTIVVSLRNTWIYPECYQLGVYEGALEMYGRQGEVTVRQFSACDVDLRIEVR